MKKKSWLLRSASSTIPYYKSPATNVYLYIYKARDRKTVYFETLQRNIVNMRNREEDPAQKSIKKLAKYKIKWKPFE